MAPRLLRLWVRIPPGVWIFVCCECCVLSLRRADRSSRGVLPIVVRRCVRPCEFGPGPRGAVVPKTNCQILILPLPKYILRVYSKEKFIIIESFYSLWSTGHPRRASKRCDLHLSHWTRSMIFLCFLFHPLLTFATFSSAYLFFYTPDDSNLMRISLLLLLLYVMCVQSNSIFF